MNPRDARPAERIPPADAPAAGGSPECRRLSFRASGLSIELEITKTEHARRLAGQLIPRQPALVDIRHAEGVTSVEADTLGRFTADVVPLGSISLRCRLSAGTGYAPVVTGWTSL